MRFSRKGKFLVLTASFLAIFLFSGVCRASQFPKDIKTLNFRVSSSTSGTLLDIPSGTYSILSANIVTGSIANSTAPHGSYHCLLNIGSSPILETNNYGNPQNFSGIVDVLSNQDVNYLCESVGSYFQGTISYVEYDLSTVESDLDVAKQTNGYLFAIIVGVAVFALIRYIFHLISSMALGW